ncbi:MAG: hypothetical protein NTY04_03320 [Candidatus Staskawiczbacteria bacterium]|nr:hypothetical protein [Candidatus Staskawiczbacteria bacterium]
MRMIESKDDPGVFELGGRWIKGMWKTTPFRPKKAHAAIPFFGYAKNGEKSILTVFIGFSVHHNDTWCGVVRSRLDAEFKKDTDYVKFLATGLTINAMIKDGLLKSKRPWFKLFLVEIICPTWILIEKLSGDDQELKF